MSDAQLWEYAVLVVNMGLNEMHLNLGGKEPERIDVDLPFFLNRLGADGWELVSNAMTTSNGSTTAERLIFKRPAE
jgi:hypothetical protein